MTGLRKNKMKKIIAPVVIVFMLLIAGVFIGCSLSKIGYKKISSAEDLLAISSNVDGKYILTEDIDMSGYEWTPLVFGGVLDGNGHKITNLSVSSTGESMRTTIDGNRKEYETEFSGMFDVLSGEVRNLELSDLVVEVQSDQPCFAGGLAGYLENGTVNNCKISGTVTLNAHDRMFGVGGICGAGYGTIKDSCIDVVLICIDTDSDTKDEQFMGGVCAVGYPDIINCNVIIDGYDSEHGYAHNGGLMGMYIYEKDVVLDGQITGNTVTGQITFFEDNDDRRAYCNWYIGEVMSVILGKSTNEEYFVSNEVFEYDIVLLPPENLVD